MKNNGPLLKIMMISALAVFSLSACGGATPVASVVTQTTLPPSQTAAPQVNPATPTETFNSIAACKAPPYAFSNVGLGLPNPSYKLPSLGNVKSIVLFADFPDAPAQETPEDLFSIISPSAENFYKDLSYGRMNWTLEPHFTWLRLSQPSSFYGEAIRSYDGHLNFIQEAVTLADADVDFSGADSVIVMVPPEASAVGYGPAFGASQGLGYSADGKTFANGVTSGADLPGWGYLWLNHESGHTMGLADLYAFQYDSSSYDDQHRFVGGFGLMGYISGNAPEYFAFERWQLGWLDDDQITCQLSGDQTTTISAIEVADGIKAVMIPLGKSKVVVIESRRALGYDSGLPKGGALVYTVDTSIASGQGPLVVEPILAADPYRYKSPLGVGESLTIDVVTVTVLAATDQTDTVQVTVAK